MLDNGTWVEFTTWGGDGDMEYMPNITGVVVDSFMENGVGYYMVQHYEGRKPVPAPSRHVVRDEPIMIRELPNLPLLRVLPDRAAAIQAEANMGAAAKRS